MTVDAGRTHIAGMSLKTLRNRYHKDLFDRYLPFMDRYGIDHELGGFICALDHDGTRANTDKYMWYQGRGLWVYSYLYNHFGGDYYLEIAQKTRDFIVRYGQADQGGWYTSLDRDGRPNSHIDKRGYAGLFVAEGLQAFAAASGDQESLDLSIRILWDMLAVLDDPQFYVDEGYVPVSYPGMRTLGSHMVLILILTQILTQRVDPALDQLAGRVRDGIMNRFWNPEYRLLNEALTTDYRRPEDGNEDFVYLGHAIETTWMMMHEAIRLNDRELLGVVAERFHRHVEVAWDDVYGGVFRGMNVHGSYLFDKVLWAQEEVLIGTMILMEHTDLEWPAYWFDKMYRHIQETFSLQPRGLPHYQESGDRKMTFKPHVSRKENYHHPRHLILNLLSLEQMMKQ